MIGSSLLGMALSFHVLEMTKDPKQFTYVLMTGVVVGVLSRPLVGYFADFMNKRSMAIFAQIISIVGIALYFVQASLLLNLIGVITLVAILALADSISNIVFQSDLKSLLGSYLSKYLSYKETISHSILILTPALAGAFYSLIGIKNLLLFSFVTESLSLVVILCIAFKKKVYVHVTNRSLKPKFINGFHDVYNYVKTQKMLLYIVVLAVILNFFLSFVTIGIQTSVITVFNYTSLQLGIVASFISIGVVGSSLAYPKLVAKGYHQFYRSAVVMLIIATLLMIVPFLILPNLALIFFSVSAFMYGSAVTLFGIPSSVYKQHYVPDEIKGKFFGLEGAILQFTLPFGYLLAGVIFSVSHSSYVIVYGTITVVLYVLLITLARDLAIATRNDDARDDTNKTA